MAVVGPEQGGAENPLAAFGFLFFAGILFQSLSGAVGEHPVPGHHRFSRNMPFSFSS